MILIRTIYQLYSLFADLLYPPQCLHCGIQILGSESTVLCSGCIDKIKCFGDNSCWYCSYKLGKFSARQKECDECRGRDRKYTRVVASCEYNQVAKSLIHAYKFKNCKLIYPFLIKYMVSRFNEEYSSVKFDYVLAVPLHRKKLASRGYNQSDLLAKWLAEQLGITYSHDIIKRIKNTSSQALLTSEERESNLRGAFEIQKQLSSSTILLVDDVFTTGSTASECARALRQAGARRIYVLVFAR